LKNYICHHKQKNRIHPEQPITLFSFMICYNAHYNGHYKQNERVNSEQRSSPFFSMTCYNPHYNGHYKQKKEATLLGYDAKGVSKYLN